MPGRRVVFAQRRHVCIASTDWCRRLQPHTHPERPNTYRGGRTATAQRTDNTNRREPVCWAVGGPIAKTNDRLRIGRSSDAGGGHRLGRDTAIRAETAAAGEMRRSDNALTSRNGGRSRPGGTQDMASSHLVPCVPYRGGDGLACLHYRDKKRSGDVMARQCCGFQRQT
ncbi:hypothetical protein LX32DRAFT_291840 [Colletotrichum zoysiae]|uniref:Uncharacterized protein n=1 Tax=Colletotrichum zoysiae TaxID=1216348 RepID=A0AAD9LT24_9PEZI|nr:hypothetical protein LX32DRAFT_291840 [Colletotrichum zoysiae]